MKKILLSILLTLCIVFTNLGAFAAETDKNVVPSGEKIATQAEYEAYLASLSQEELQIIADKNTAINKILELKAKTRGLSQTLISLPSNFTIYQQENSYYCVPATVKSILLYLVGSSPSQTSIATSLAPMKMVLHLH